MLNRKFGCVSSNLLIQLRQKLIPAPADGGKKKNDFQPEVIERLRQAAE